MTEPSDTPKNAADDELLLTPTQQAELTEALLSAYRPHELDHGLNDALIEAALEDPLRAATEQELIDSARFRRALEGHGEHPDLELARQLAALHTAPRGNVELEDFHERAIERALEPARASKGGASSFGVVYVSFGIASALAAAAAVLLLVASDFWGRNAETAASDETASEPPSLTQSRSSEPLFEGKFERERTTRRVDRIASVRARELRANRFKQWGLP